MTTESTQDLSRRALLLIGTSATVAACGAEITAIDLDAEIRTDASTDASDASTSDTGALDTSFADVARVDTGAPDTGPTCAPPSTAVRIGPIVSFAVGRWVAITSQAIIIGRDARGIFAYSNVCPHRSCAVPAPASATATSRCPCHSAIFTSDGAVVSGPTTRSLLNYPVTVCDNNVYVDKTRTVPMGTRTVVP